MDVGQPRRPRVQLDAAEVGQPHHRRHAVGHRVPLGLAPVGLVVVPPLHEVGGVRRRLLVPEARLVDAVGVAVGVERPAAQVAQDRRRDHRVVADEVALGQRLGVVVAAREQHLVEVGEGERVALDLPAALRPEGVEGGELVRGRPVPGRRLRPGLVGLGLGAGAHPHLGLVGRPVAVPLVVGVGLDLVVGAAGLDGGGVVLGVPARLGVVVVLVEHEPLLLAAARPGPFSVRTSTNRPASRSPVRSKWISPASMAAAGSSVSTGAQVPRSHTMTSPPPYCPAPITPSNSAYSMGWSSTWTARRRALGSSVGPLGTAQLASTPSTSRRKS